MKIVTVVKADAGCLEEPDPDVKLFPDRVTGCLCMLRYKLKGGFIGGGCFIDRIMSM